MTRLGILFIAVMFFITGCGKSTKKTTPELNEHQKKVLSYLPENTQFVMYMNLNDLRDTPFWQDYFTSVLQKNPGSSWLDNFENETGAGVNDGLVEFITTGSWSGNEATVLTFDKNLNRIKKYFADKKKFVQIEFEGKKLYKSKENKKTKYIFADDSTLIVFSNESYLSNLTGKTSIKNNKSLYPIIKSIENKQQYWIATDDGVYASAILEQLVAVYKKLPGKNLIKNIKSVTLAANFNEGVKIESGWGCVDSKSAYLLSAAIKGALAMDLLSGKDEALNKVLQKMIVDHNQQNINFEINLNKNDLSEIKSFAKKNQLDKKL